MKRIKSEVELVEKRNGVAREEEVIDVAIVEAYRLRICERSVWWHERGELFKNELPAKWESRIFNLTFKLNGH